MGNSSVMKPELLCNFINVRIDIISVKFYKKMNREKTKYSHSCKKNRCSL